MHIADITMFWAPASGGVRTYLEAKDTWLGKQIGLRHSMLVPGASRTRQGNRITVPAPPIPFGNGYRFPLRRRAWVEELLELTPDVIEAGDPYVLPWAALEAGRRLQVPVVGFYHSDLPRLVGSRAGHWTNRLLNDYVVRLYQRFDRVLAPSQIMVDKLRALGLERVHLQHLGVDTTRFHPRLRNSALRTRLGLADDARLLIFAGRGAREKNLPVLLKAMQLLGEAYHLHLVGSHLPRRLPANVSKTDCFVDKPQLARLLAGSDALVHAGDRETFGLIVLEAMASGLPVVGVRAGAVAELVVSGTGLLAEPLSAASLAGSIRVLFREDWQAMGQQARRHVEEHFGWDQVLPQLLQHYQELTGQTYPLREAIHG